MTPFFSIIVPCCDVEQYVRESLDSVLNQPFRDWECIIGVETSKDRTEEIVREYAAKDSRFKVFTGPRSGSCSASRNTGIDMATGEYVIFLDGDDTIAEGSLQRLHDKITARPGADIYPCAIRVYDDDSRKEVELRDNYPKDFNDELTGPDATVLLERLWFNYLCPMLQLSVFHRAFLVENNLKCIRGLRRQDSEFSPRALYLARRVVPLHEPFYLYSIHTSSVSSQAKGRGAGYFHKDWAIIIKSLLAFHAAVSKKDNFDHRVATSWASQWLSWILFFWFSPYNIKTIPREKRLETLGVLFSDGFEDLNALLKAASRTRQIAFWWIKLFVRVSIARGLSEAFFKVYFSLSEKKRSHGAKSPDCRFKTADAICAVAG